VDEIEALEDELETLEKKEEEEKKSFSELKTQRSELESDVAEKRRSRKELTEQKFVIQKKIANLQVEKARSETQIDDLQKQADEFKDIKERLELSAEKLQEIITSSLYEIRKLGPVNMKAIEEYGTISVEFEEMKKKLNKLLEEKESITKTIDEVEKKRTKKFSSTLMEIRDHFSKIYKDLTGGHGTIRLEEENNIDSGLVIEASPEGKRVLDLDVMSGGEKTVTSLAFLFAIMQHYSSPFYVLDEVDAALDKANTRKIANLVKKYSKTIQFIVISHNDITTSSADKVFGVSMQDGASKIFGLDMPRS
jgi:chromosome segregation protein